MALPLAGRDFYLLFEFLFKEASMAKITFLKHFFSKWYSVSYLIALGATSYFVVLSYWHLLHIDDFDFSVKTMRFSYLESDGRGKLPHVFWAYKDGEIVMSFSRHADIPSLEKMLTARLPELKGGVAYYVETRADFGGNGNTRTLLGVDFFNGIKVGQKVLPKSHISNIKRITRKMGLIALFFLTLLLLFPLYKLYKYKDINNEKVNVL